MLYPINDTEKLDMDLFRNPTAEYRAAPFWAWNCELDPTLLEKEIELIIFRLSWRHFRHT